MRSAAGKRYFRDYGLLVLNAVMFSILMFGTDVFLEFTTDTYRTFAVGVGKKARDMIVRNGRPVIALYYRLFGMTGLKEELFYYISFITGLLLTVEISLNLGRCTPSLYFLISSSIPGSTCL